MSRTLREAAARFIEAGRALGYSEQSRLIAAQLEKILADPVREPALAERELRDAVTVLAVWHIEACERNERSAEADRCRAERLMAELEHPGARLARRVLGAARAAQQAWRDVR